MCRRGLAALCVGLFMLVSAPAVAAPTPATLPPPAAKQTSTGRSPEVPNPHPPLGGIGPDGSLIGGPRLLSRGLVVPFGSPKLPKNLTARAWVLADLKTGEILAARDPHGRYQPASILKTLTALVLLPQLSGRRIVRPSQNAANAEGSAVGLVPNGRYTVDQLFESLLMMSGNDAAIALAEASGGVSQTVARMNAETKTLGAYDTYVETPSGLDGWKQLTSAYDMTLILRAAIADPRFVKYDRTLMTTLPAQKADGRKWPDVPLANQSEDFLRSVPGALIAKTGYTDAAKHTYLCAAQRDGRTLGVVFLRAQRQPLDEWQQAARLLNWGFKTDGHLKPVGQLMGPISPSAPNASPAPLGQSQSHAAAAPVHGAGRSHLLSASWPGLAALAAILAVAAAAVLLANARGRGRRQDFPSG